MTQDQAAAIIGRMITEYGQLQPVLEAARRLVRHWEDQDGFGADVVDALALAVRIFDGRVRFGPDASRCVFCGTYGDESTLDPVSGDGWGCGPCVDRYQRGGQP